VGFKVKMDTRKNDIGSYGVYVNSRTRVKAMAGISEEFNILVGAHQGSVLCPLSL